MGLINKQTGQSKYRQKTRCKPILVFVQPTTRENEACISLLLLSGSLPHISGPLFVAEASSAKVYEQALSELHTNFTESWTTIVSRKSRKSAWKRLMDASQKVRKLVTLLDLGRRGLTTECKEFVSIKRSRKRFREGKGRQVKILNY